MEEPSKSEPSSRDSAVLRWIGDFAPYGVITTDREFRVQSWNKWMTTHSGKDSDEIIGRTLIEIFPDLVERNLLPRFERALAGEVSVLSTALHGYLLKLDPTIDQDVFKEMQQTTRIAPLVLDEEIVGTIIVIEDVTQREIQAKVLRQQHERDIILSWALAHLLESKNPRQSIRDLFLKIAEHLDWEAYVLFLIEPDRKTLKLHAAGGISPEAEHQLSVLEEGNPIATFLLSNAQASVCEEIKTSSAVGNPVFQQLGFSACAVMPLRSRDEEIGVLCFGTHSRSTLLDGEIELLSTIGKYLAVALQKDATHFALQVAQAKLNDHAQNLELQVAERTAKLREIIAELETFSYTLAHDLRAPIRALIGYSEVLIEDYSNLIPEEGQAVIQRLQRACKQLDRLTRDLLEFSSVSRKDITLTPVDLDELVTDVLSLLSSAKVHVTVRRPLHRVMAHKSSLQQCISNLIDNALKFTKEDVPPRITLWTELLDGVASSEAISHNAPFNTATKIPGEGANPLQQPESGLREGGPRVRICVQDCGIGIPPEAHSKIFGIFERGTSATQYSGSGIGLAIVTRAMQKMGGNCGVKSTPGAGSCFWLELPPA
jgi:signal transduction histidine kinase/PAS domain-containing protein